VRTLAETTWVELKLFAREPLTVIFTLALPVIVLYILGGVFGDTPDPQGQVYRGVGAMTYYVPAYIGLVIASMGLIGLPVHLAGYRERGVLRRFRASGMPVWSVLGAQVAVTFAVSILGGAMVVALANLTYEVQAPASVAGVLTAFVVSTLSFAALGVLLGAVLPTARAAQGAGVLLWFVMLMVSGAGPPPEVLNDTLTRVADATPLKHVILTLQDPWLGLGSNLAELLVVAGILALSALLALRLFRWQ
jgi:ABC-2 type transport system permease protein